MKWLLAIFVVVMLGTALVMWIAAICYMLNEHRSGRW